MVLTVPMALTARTVPKAPPVRTVPMVLTPSIGVTVTRPIEPVKES